MTISPASTGSASTSQYGFRSVSPFMAVLHHGATTSAEQIIAMMVTGSRVVSAHQVVKDGSRTAVVPEQYRAFSLSSAYWDSAAFTVECANESTDGWTVSAASHESLAILVADWATRYGWWPHRDGDDETWTVIGHREVYSIHDASYATACPGGMDLDWIARRAQQIMHGTTSPERNPMTTLYVSQIPATIAPADLSFLNTLVNTGPLVTKAGLYLIALCGDSPGTKANVQLSGLDKLGNEWAADHTGTIDGVDGVTIKKGGRVLSWPHFVATLRAYLAPLSVSSGGGSTDFSSLVEAINAQTAVLGTKLDALPAATAAETIRQQKLPGN